MEKTHKHLEKLLHDEQRENKMSETELISTNY